jgi:hypothetical protein
MRSADNRPVANQKTARRIVEPTTRVRTDVEIGVRLVAVPVDQKRLHLMVDEGFDFDGIAVGNVRQEAEGRGIGVRSHGTCLWGWVAPR